MAFPSLVNSDHVVSLSMNFPSYSQRDAPFHHIAYDYFRVDYGRISLNAMLQLLLVNFVSGFRLELMYIYFQQLVLLP